MSESWIPAPESTSVALVSTSQPLRDETARVAAAAGLILIAAASISEALVQRPAVVLVDAESAGQPATGTETIVVGLSGEENLVWTAAARCGAGRVAVLPQASGWLAEYLGRLRAGTAGHVLGVLGSSGGAGATTVSCWVAAHSAASGTPTLLVDGDPLGGGLELAAGLESQPGVRWPDVGEVRGTLNPAQLAEALPSVDGLSILSMGVDPPEPGVLATPAVPSVLQAARNAFELTVVDLARGWSVDGSLLPYCDSFLLVIPGRLRAISAARALVPQLRPVPVLALVRGPVGPDLDPHRIAETAGCPLAGHLPHLRGTSSAENQGRLLEMRTQRSVRRFADAVLRSLSSPGTPVMP